MDSRLIITVLLATLSWGFLGTYGQSTAAPNMTNVTAANMTSMNMTSMNMTSMNMTSMNMTSMNMTLMNMTSMNMTSMNMTSMNMTSMNMTSMNMTSMNMTSMNMTSMNMTSMNMTTAAPQTMTTSTAAPFTPNNTVANLTMPPSRGGCGSSRLCVAEPSSCDPSAAGSCFFVSTMPQGGQDFRCELSGQSDGFLGTTLSVDTMLGGNDTTYICANNNGNVQFIGALLDNGMLTATTLDVNNVSGRVSGGTIQCVFTVRVPSSARATRMTPSTSFSASIITGTFDPASGVLGTPTARVTTNVVNLADANATVTNMASNSTTNTTAATPTSNTTSNTNTATSNTTSNTTNAGGTTAAPQNMTASTAAPFAVNTTVANLPMSPSSDGCGSNRLCVAEPSSCDPSAAGSCFFLSAMQQSGQDFRCELSGQSDGYLGTTLSVDTMLGGNDTTYICANNNGAVQFVSALLDDGMFARTLLNVNNVSGRVNGDTIQCVFTIRVPIAITNRMTRTTLFSASIITGSFNASSGALGTPTARVTTNVVNLADANANVTNMASNSTTNTTATPATTTATAHGVTVHYSLMQSLLITSIVVGLAML